MRAQLVMTAGFLLAIAGIAQLSYAAACMVAGVVGFLAGGLEHRYRRTK